MLSQRAALSFGDRAAAARERATRSDDATNLIDTSLVRLLVLDSNPNTAQQIENALWMWPHRISIASNATNAVRICQQLEPSALIVSSDFPSAYPVSIVSSLRNELPNTVIIALATAAEAESPAPILDLGANAVLTREELQRPTLHDLLMRLKEPAEDEVAQVSQVFRGGAPMALHWRESQIVGSLICDIKGTITSANECLARWLKYPTPLALSGKCVWRDILNCRNDWTSWTTVAGDMTSLLHKSVSIKASDQQLLWMDVEIFAAPNSPTEIQAVFVGQSKLAHQSGKFEDC